MYFCIPLARTPCTTTIWQLQHAAAFKRGTSRGFLMGHVKDLGENVPPRVRDKLKSDSTEIPRAMRDTERPIRD